MRFPHFRAQFHRHVTAEGRQGAAQIDHDVEHAACNDAHELGLGSTPMPSAAKVSRRHVSMNQPRPSLKRFGRTRMTSGNAVAIASMAADQDLVPSQ
jgi:hypothetical protein